MCACWCAVLAITSNGFIPSKSATFTAVAVLIECCPDLFIDTDARTKSPRVFKTLDAAVSALEQVGFKVEGLSKA